MAFPLDPNTIITTTISPGLARNIAFEFLKQTQAPDVSTAITQQFNEAIRSLTITGIGSITRELDWSLNLNSMKLAITWIIKCLKDMEQDQKSQFQNDQEELNKIAKDVVKQIIKAGDIQFEQFVGNVAPELLK